MIKITSVAQVVKPLVLFYVFLGILYWVIFLAPGEGDEGLMSLYLEEGKHQGFYWLIQAGNFSLPYSLIVYPLCFIFPCYMALRIGSLAGSLFLFFYLKRRLNFKSQSFKNHILFYLFSGSFLLGTNDNLLFCLLTVFFTEVFLVLVKRQERIPLYALACMVTALFTRMMAIIYFPVIIYGLFLVYFRKGIYRKEYLTVFATGFLWFGLNIPSIQSNGLISFDNKDTIFQLGLTWVQRQYLSQIYANEGKIPQFSHVTWEQTLEYVQENGDENLPKTSLEAILFDISFTLKEFVKDFIYMVYSGIRQSGLAVMFPLIGLSLYFKTGNRGYFFLGASQLFTMLAISFLIISYIEIRWLAPVFIMGIIGLESMIQSSKRTTNYFDICNQCILLALGIYGSWRYISLIKTTQFFQSLI